MPDRRKHIVLIVDDDEINRLLARSVLQKFDDITIVEVDDGVDAIALVIAGHRFDVILMDVMMPIVDGVTAAMKIKELDPNCIIIRVSSFGNEYKEHSGIFDAIVDKPVSAKLLGETVNDFLK